ncbi:MAG TPA: flagellar filament outer layer protein FlaA [Spirochaetia bacterium]|nr:flagellar filament outer layer protein FlaA [Spirochaetia bacterium]
MRRGGLFSLSLFAVLLLLASVTAYADDVTQNIQSIVLENFIEPTQHQWIVTGSKFATKDYPQSAVVKTWPDALYRTAPEGKDLRSLGIHSKFDRMAYNYIEIIPATKGQDGKLVPTAIDLPGRVKSMDVWMWGSYHDFYVEAQVRDYRGMVYVLRLGSLAFRGWKDLTVDIPTYIPQSVTYLPATKNLQLVKLVIWTTPNEAVNDFYVYVNQLKVLTDTFESPWDGESLTNSSYVEKLWSQAGTTTPSGQPAPGTTGTSTQGQ